jgi:hypothetical protein
VASVCKFCSATNKPLVKAHIVPQSFYGVVKGQPLAGLRSEFSKPRWAWTGVYDNELLCSDCEASFAKLDDYAFNALFERPSKSSPPSLRGVDLFPDQLRPVAFRIPGADPERLKLFVYSMFWRAHVSIRNECKGIDVGPFVSDLFEAIKKWSSSNCDCDVMLGRQGQAAASGGVMLGMKTRLDGVRFNWLFAGGYNFYLKCDSRKLSNSHFRRIHKSPRARCGRSRKGKPTGPANSRSTAGRRTMTPTRAWTPTPWTWTIAGRWFWTR